MFKMMIMTEQDYLKGIRCRGICDLCGVNKIGCYQYIQQNAAQREKEQRIKELNKKYANAFKESAKNELVLLLNDFIDNETIDKDYKQKILDSVTNLLTLSK